MKEHIKRLTNLLYGESTGMRDSIEFAIELMRAAKPLDEAAERERCRALAADARDADESLTLVDWLMRERAQTRAESVIPLMQRLTAECLRNAALTAQLSAAQAEIAEKARVLTIAFDDRDCAIREMEAARARPTIQTVAYDHRAMNALATLRSDYDALKTKLSAAQAELATLNQQLEYERDLHGEINALETKLTNLRAAAEDIADLIEEGSTRRRFRAAIEASR